MREIGDWFPRWPLTLAEQHVDYTSLHLHILHRRSVVERSGRAATRQVAASVADFTQVSPAAHARLEERLGVSLAASARFGYSTARREITSQRRPDERTVSARARSVPDAGRFAIVALGGIDAVISHTKRRASQAALAIAAAASEGLHDPAEPDKVIAATLAALRELHNQTLELVGEALNLGRAAGALSFPQPPEFALRSEQLDKATCDECSRRHGTIVLVGSPEFWDEMPPAGCYGGGRCRGVMVYGDTHDAVAPAKAA